MMTNLLTKDDLVNFLDRLVDKIKTIDKPETIETLEYHVIIENGIHKMPDGSINHDGTKSINIEIRLKEIN